MAPTRIDKKRQELLKPIIKRAKEAIAVVAKAKGYSMVFDSSIFGNILFAGETTDLTPAVMAHLGIKQE